MKFLTFIRHSESHRQSGPPAAFMAAMGEFVQRSMKDGTLVDCEFINVESEFAALSVAIGASAAGARACAHGTA